jgi:hypothetical protein
MSKTSVDEVSTLDTAVPFCREGLPESAYSNVLHLLQASVEIFVLDLT